MKALHLLLKTDSDLSTLIARVLLGLVFFPHGAQKVLGWWGGYGFSGTMGFFTGTMGIPAIFAFLAIAAEFAGAIGLIFGLFTRISALGIAGVMAVAVAMVHGQHGFFMNWYGNQKGEGFEYHVLAIALAVLLVLRGGGKWSVDGVIAGALESGDAAGSEVRKSTQPVAPVYAAAARNR